jgi:hypothetical protein
MVTKTLPRPKKINGEKESKIFLLAAEALVAMNAVFVATKGWSLTDEVKPDSISTIEDVFLYLEKIEKRLSSPQGDSKYSVAVRQGDQVEWVFLTAEQIAMRFLENFIALIKVVVNDT